MTIRYSIDENDFLIHQLYTASKSKRIKNKRLRSQFVVPIIYILFGLYGYMTDRPVLMAIFIAFAVLWLLLYPFWERKRYVNHYKNFIKENYKNRFDKIGTITFSDEFIITKEEENESKISTKEIEKITELKPLVLVKLKDGQSLILSKDKIGEIDKLIDNLKELAIKLRIDYNIEENWEWR